MISIKFQNDEYNLPSCWDELTTAQLERLAQLVEYKITTNELLFRFALYCMGMRMALRYRVTVDGEDCFYVRHGLTRVYLVSPGQMAVLADTLAWLVCENSIKPNSCKNPYYEFYPKRFRRLFGPTDGLTNITLSEWIQAEVERSTWERLNNEHHLNRLLAILWRPTTARHPDGDMRAPLRQDTLETRAKQMARIPNHKRQVMLWFYHGCTAFLAKRFDDVFAGGSPSDASTFDSFMQLVNDLAKNDLTKIDKVREAPLYEALYNIQNIMKQNEKPKPHENPV